MKRRKTRKPVPLKFKDIYRMPLYDFVNNQTESMAQLTQQARRLCRKRPVDHTCYVLSGPAEFITSSGKQTGHPGDVVIVGKDHAWPVSREYFDEHYDVDESF